MMFNEIKTPLEKLVWYWIKHQGQTTPEQISQEIDVPKRSVVRALTELRICGFVARVSFGLYCATGGAPHAMLGAPHAMGGAKCATSDIGFNGYPLDSSPSKF